MHDLAQRADVPVETLSDFMCGDAPLDFESLRRIRVAPTGPLNQTA